MHQLKHIIFSSLTDAKSVDAGWERKDWNHRWNDSTLEIISCCHVPLHDDEGHAYFMLS